jgi:proline iminopeptidase
VALGVGGGTALLVVVVSSLTVFKPLVTASEMTPLAVPPEVAFWDLPTGSHIAYRKVAAVAGAERAPVIYVHGGPGAGVVSVEELVRAFSFPARLGHDVFLYDQIGGGLSGRLSDVSEYTLERHISDLEAIRVRLGTDRVVLMGESWGAELATQYLAAHPERVDRLILLSPGPLYPKEWGDRDPCDLKGRASAESQQTFDRFIGPRLWAAALLLEVDPVAAHAFLPDAEGDATIRRMLAPLLPGGVCDPANLPSGEHFAFGMWANLMTDEDYSERENRVEASLSRLETPVLILRGECDYCLPEVASQYDSIFANSTLVDVENAGHFIWLEEPEVLAEVVGTFLSRETGPRLH